jgi:hypothetical protein
MKVVNWMMGAVAAIGGFALYKITRAPAAPAVAVPVQAASTLPGGFRIGDSVLVSPDRFFNQQFPTGEDMTTPVSAVVTDPTGTNLFPFGIPSITVRSTDRRVSAALQAIVPITSVRKV